MRCKRLIRSEKCPMRKGDSAEDRNPGLQFLRIGPPTQQQPLACLFLQDVGFRHYGRSETLALGVTGPGPDYAVLATVLIALPHGDVLRFP